MSQSNPFISKKSDQSQSNNIELRRTVICFVLWPHAAHYQNKNTNKHAAIYLLLTSDEIFMELGCSNGSARASYFHRWFIIRLTRCAVSAAKEEKYQFSFIFCHDAGFRSDRSKRFYFRLHSKHFCRVLLPFKPRHSASLANKVVWINLFFSSFGRRRAGFFFSFICLTLFPTNELNAETE